VFRVESDASLQARPIYDRVIVFVPSSSLWSQQISRRNSHSRIVFICLFSSVAIFLSRCFMPSGNDIVYPRRSHPTSLCGHLFQFQAGLSPPGSIFHCFPSDLFLLLYSTSFNVPEFLQSLFLSTGRGVDVMTRRFFIKSIPPPIFLMQLITLSSLHSRSVFSCVSCRTFHFHTTSYIKS